MKAKARSLQKCSMPEENKIHKLLMSNSATIKPDEQYSAKSHKQIFHDSSP